MKFSVRGLIGLLSGCLLLAAVWLVSVALEPYLIALAITPSAVGEPRGKLVGWANSDVWLIAQTACLFGLLVAGFFSKRLSPAQSWAAPGVRFVICGLYVLLARIPATNVSWRVVYWSLGSVLAVAGGAWLGRVKRAV